MVEKLGSGGAFSGFCAVSYSRTSDPSEPSVRCKNGRYICLSNQKFAHLICTNQNTNPGVSGNDVQPINNQLFVQVQVSLLIGHRHAQCCKPLFFAFELAKTVAFAGVLHFSGGFVEIYTAPLVFNELLSEPAAGSNSR